MWRQRVATVWQRLDAALRATRQGMAMGNMRQQRSTLYFTTRDRIHGREIMEEFGMVSASAVRSKSLISDVYVALTGLFGGEAISYTGLMNECTAEAMHRMQYAAESLGATAVVNVRFTSNTTMNRLVFGLHCSVIAYGTAVRCRPKTLHHHEATTDAADPVVDGTSALPPEGPDPDRGGPLL